VISEGSTVKHSPHYNVPMMQGRKSNGAGKYLMESLISSQALFGSCREDQEMYEHKNGILQSWHLIKDIL
jgi:hypothetical protein